jgi:hypothetical protein
MPGDRLTIAGLGGAVRDFGKRATRTRKKGECRDCKKLRRELAPVIELLAVMAERSDVVVDDMRVNDGEAVVAEWLAEQSGSAEISRARIGRSYAGRSLPGTGVPDRSHARH